MVTAAARAPVHGHGRRPRRLLAPPLRCWRGGARRWPGGRARSTKHPEGASHLAILPSPLSHARLPPPIPFLSPSFPQMEVDLEKIMLRKEMVMLT